MARDKTSHTPNHTAQFIRWNRKALVMLLERDEPFAKVDCDGISWHHWRGSIRAGLIKRSSDYKPGNRTYILTDFGRQKLEAASEELQASHEEGTLVCPHCGHAGFKNLLDGEYECRSPQCGKEFAEFEEVGSA